MPLGRWLLCGGVGVGERTRGQGSWRLQFGKPGRASVKLLGAFRIKPWSGRLLPWPEALSGALMPPPSLSGTFLSPSGAYSHGFLFIPWDIPWENRGT